MPAEYLQVMGLPKFGAEAPYNHAKGRVGQHHYRPCSGSQGIADGNGDVDYQTIGIAPIVVRVKYIICRCPRTICPQCEDGGDDSGGDWVGVGS